jgi:succinoglycan biosynthesis transport protein ExoP
MDVLAGKRIRPLTILSRDLAEGESDLSRRPSTSDDGLQALRQALDSVRKYRRLVV